ncbi:MAG: hypothetical protein FWB88_10815 [Defluviitaleaceae bacterium]|nr:hypothetical protein [Defluviitaleaceae bacterium]MCL2240081.1 hypothetical protein [Defluviitaleaceae bacterium]MCL2240296.1 hypothetical protein [Defluviitaleaceae bacterium]
MTESMAMLEIHKIKNENSLRYRKMSPEELTKNFDETTNKFIKRMGKDIKIINLPTTQG